jgi:4-aminobutyrate aminotransferase-like enzyme
MNELKDYLFAHGLFVSTHWNLLLIIPPLIITSEQLEEGLKIINDGLAITDRYIN